MARKLALALTLLLVLLVAVIATRPATYAVQRAATFHAPREVVYRQLVDLRTWKSWSPWAGREIRIEGPDAAVGSVMTWDGGLRVGRGRVTLTELGRDRHVGFQIDHLSPVPGQAGSAFELVPEGEDTRVIWALKGRLGFLGKAVSLVRDPERAIGAELEEGLASLRIVCEREAQVAPAPGGAGAATSP